MRTVCECVPHPLHPKHSFSIYTLETYDCFSSLLNIEKYPLYYTLPNSAKSGVKQIHTVSTIFFLNQ